MKRAREAYPEKYAAALARKRARTTASVAVKAEVARQLRQHADLLATDFYSAAFNVTDAGTVTSALSSLIRGDNGFNNFAGNQIIPTSFRLKFTTSIPGLSAVFNSTVRVMVVQWFDASVPTPTGLIQAVGGPQSTLSPPSTTNKDVMTVLHDKLYPLNPQSGNGTAQGLVNTSRQIYIPGKRLKPVKFNSTTTAIQDGGIYILYISSTAAAGSVFPAMVSYSRVTFTD